MKTQEELYIKYPELFFQKDLDKKQTCMYWGIECGEGWYPLLDKLCEKIMAHCKESNETLPQFSQVKEKFGTLRVYCDYSSDSIDKLISEAESESEVTCEHCGDAGECNTDGGWLTTLCTKCRDKRESGN